MADLNITRFRFRLRRRGWARGDAGQRVVKAARQRLPSLVAERLEEVWPEDDADISEPVRLRLRVRLAELAAACESDEALAALVARLLPMETEAPADVGGGGTRRFAKTAHPPAGHSEVPDSALPAAAAVARVLLRWRAQGHLAAHLDSFADGALDDWERALVHGEGPAAWPPRSVAAADVDAIVRSYVLPPPTGRAGLVQRRILAAVEVLARLEVAPGTPEIARALETLLPLPAETLPSSAATVHRRSLSFEMPRAPARQVTAPSLVSAARDAAGPRTERTIESALPFLLLRPLERLGYLDALDAAFTAAGRRDELPAFATALAYKVLAPPARGWRRPGAAQAAAAAFAGREEPSPDSEIAAIAKGAEPLVALLDGLVARSLLDGHDASLPLLLGRHAEAWLLLESDGLFPIAWGDGDGILRALGACRAPLVLFADAAEPSLLAALDAGGKRFITDAPPTRGEPWRRLRRRGRVLFGNDGSDALARAAEQLDSFDEVRSLLEALALRRAVRSDGGGALERSLELAAGAALGEIAWRLFRHREPSTPRLALERFADLGARLRCDEHGVEVRLPLGRRSHDLQAHGLLGDARVPWLRGQTVRIAGS